MKRALTITLAVALGVLLAGTALAQMGHGAGGPMGPGQMSEQMAKMMNMFTKMQEQMKGMQGMGSMHGGMGSMMGMMGEMQKTMTQHQETMREQCAGMMGASSPKSH